MTTPINLLELPLEEKFAAVEGLWLQLRPIKNLDGRLKLLNQSHSVQSFLDKTPALRAFLDDAFPECDYAIKALLAIGQGPIVFNSIECVEDRFDKLRELLHTLLEIEHFYDTIGGIVGYYYTFLKLLVERKNRPHTPSDEEVFLKPCGIDISKAAKSLQNQAIKAGLDCLPLLAEVYPIGGAGERLNFRDAQGEPLPAAQLPFGGITLLERLIIDLQAREYLYWKLKGTQIATPIVMMGSHEKNNISLLLHLCQEKRWFGRAPDSFQMLIQPLVPQITENGDFSLSEFLKFSLKPGGHGAIWKLAEDGGVFEWLKQRGRFKLLLRQINNPAIGIDHSLLAFAGIGAFKDKSFGFMSCQRLLNSAEGMLVLKEKKKDQHFLYSIVNIEYTDFHAKGIKDTPEHEGSSYSAFPANINVLFADIERIQRALKDNSLPGLLINTKKKAPYIDPEGTLCYVPAGRLESTMQNIADCMVDELPKKLTDHEIDKLSSYIVYNERIKSLSVTKNEFNPEKSLQDTPQGCMHDLLTNCRDLLTNHCAIDMPKMVSEQEYLQDGPSFIVSYHPALGPLYSVIGQKIQGGKIHEKSLMHLHIAELDMRHINLLGAVKIIAKDPFGDCDDITGRVSYSHDGGKCELHHVTICNKGVNYQAQNCHWSSSYAFEELLEIVLHGNGEFFADSVEFRGSLRIEVPHGYRVEASMIDDKVVYKTLRIDEPTWYWSYAFKEDNSIALSKIHAKA